MGYEDLLRRAELGQITEEETRRVSRELASSAPPTDRFTLLQILGEAEAKFARPLVESFLECPEDPLLSRLALEILCAYWDEAPRYLPELRRFIDGVAWDCEAEVRQAAILLAGSHLRSNADPYLLHSIMKIVRDPSERMILRGSAYLALGRSIGREWNELPSTTKVFDVDAEADPQILEEAEARLRHEEARLWGK